jgi:DNA polymerase-3 subunit delta
MATTTATTQPVALVCGDDDFGVKQRALQLYQQWTKELGGMDHEAIDASVSNGSEALKALARLREALQTLPFFGGAKVVWFKNCNFLGDERAASTQAVTENLSDLAQDLKKFKWTGVRLLLSAGKVDKRRTFYKTLEKLGTVESFESLTLEDKEWAAKAEQFALKQFRASGRKIADDALAALVEQVGPNLRQLAGEIEKLEIYVGERACIEIGDVRTIVTRNKQARAFALADSLGDRDLPRLLRCLDEELWAMKLDTQKSEFGLLYGLISKVRSMLLMKELAQAGLVKPAPDYSRFKSQLDRVPTGLMSEDRRLNPLTSHPFVLFNASRQAANYTPAELIRAMDLLLQCNQRLIYSSMDESIVLQKTLTEIVRKAAPSVPAAR